MKFLKYGPIQAVFALVFVLIMLPITIISSVRATDDNIARQNEHMEYLKNEYYTESYVPCDESKIASFDINKAIADGVKFNEVAFLGTHNSYQTEATRAFVLFYKALDILTFSLVDGGVTSFEMDTLTEQLELGVRNLEIDIETVVDGEETDFIVSHSPVFDNTSSCYDFEKALDELIMWSDANPGHLPVSIIIEPKKNLPRVNGLRNFGLEYANTFDALLREKLGDRLLTPAQMMGEYESFKAMRDDNGWLKLEDTLGKFLILLHDTKVTEEYIMQDETIKTQAMFPMLRYDDIHESYTSFILCNDPEEAVEYKSETIGKCNLIVRTRADEYPGYSDERYALTEKCGSQIITTDYPFRAGTDAPHVYSFDGYTVKLISD